MTDSITVRPAAPEDTDTLLALLDALSDYEHLPRPDPGARERLRQDLAEGRYFSALLAEADGRPAGYALYFFTYSSFLARPTLYLEDIFVVPDRRRHGVGTAIMQRLIQEAKERGCGRMEWQVLDWNQTAMDFYHGLGASHQKEWLPYRLEIPSPSGRGLG